MKFIELFNDVVENNPNKIAIKSNQDCLTFFELNKLSDEIIFKVITISNNGIIAINADHSINHFILMLACIKAGITFININMNDPKSFISVILDAANIHTILNMSSSFDERKTYSYEEICSLKESDNKLIDKNEWLYIVATSGSSGIPKLVKKHDKSLLRSYYQIKKHLPFLFDEKHQIFAPLHFAFGLDQSLILLFGGSTLIFSDKSDFADMDYYGSCIKNNNATSIFWSAAMVKLLSRQPFLFEKIPSCLKYIIVGGEPIVVSASFIFEMKRKNIKLINNYGSTETGTLFFTVFEKQLYDVEEFNKVPVGIPLEGFKVILENVQEDKGLLSIQSENFWNEYLNNQTASENRFRKNESGYICKIDDICEYKNSEYYVVGRLNNCVNIRGYRVEIEYVESIISKALSGEECCVVPCTNNLAETRLYCFYSGTIDNEHLKKCIQQELPEYMVPTHFFQIDYIHHLKNGKLDRVGMNKLLSSVLQTNNVMNEDLQSRIIGYVESLLNYSVKKEQINIPLKELGIDSIALADLICIIEFKEKVHIEDGVIFSKKISTIEDICNYILVKKDHNEYNGKNL